MSMDNPNYYTKDMLDEHFKDMNRRFDQQDNKLAEIQAVGKATDTKVGIQNGRVSKLESRWMGVVMAGSATIFLIGIIISLGVYSFNTKLQQVQASILLKVQQMQK